MPNQKSLLDIYVLNLPFCILILPYGIAIKKFAVRLTVNIGVTVIRRASTRMLSPDAVCDSQMKPLNITELMLEASHNKS